MILTITAVSVACLTLTYSRTYMPHTYTDKSVSRSVTSIFVRIKKGHTSYFEPVNAIIGFFELFKSVQNTWKQCISSQFMAHTISNSYVTNSQPCFKGSIFLNTNAWLYEITVLQSLHVNLTFTHFHLKRTMVDCPYHYLMVS